MYHPTKYWHKLDDGRVQCDVCPRACKMHDGQRGLCFVRGVEDGEVRLYTYGRSSGFCVDPIEKKPLNHFLPGTSVLSFGTAGCNLACKFCFHPDTLVATTGGSAHRGTLRGMRGEDCRWSRPDRIPEFAARVDAHGRAGSRCQGLRASTLRFIAVAQGELLPAHPADCESQGVRGTSFKSRGHRADRSRQADAGPLPRRSEAPGSGQRRTDQCCCSVGRRRMQRACRSHQALPVG